jgi:hypothetical protein
MNPFPLPPQIPDTQVPQVPRPGQAASGMDRILALLQAPQIQNLLGQFLANKAGPYAGQQFSQTFMPEIMRQQMVEEERRQKRVQEARQAMADLLQRKEFESQDALRQAQTTALGRKETAPISVSEGTTILDPTTMQPVFTNPKTKTAKSLQPKEIVGPDEKPVYANYDPDTGKFLDASGKEIPNAQPFVREPAEKSGEFERWREQFRKEKGREPTTGEIDARATKLRSVGPSIYLSGANERQERAQEFTRENLERKETLPLAKAKPVFDSISELSERINVNQGVLAKAVGEVEKAKARVNLNDDVAEYQALVSGFTPLIARSVGHVGVLTEQDVQSVRQLFPKPGDSKSLRDRKIKRLMSIVGGVTESISVAFDKSAGTKHETPKPTHRFNPKTGKIELLK